MIYLDHAATTPPAPAVREAVQAYMGERFGNASSPHRRGRESAVAVRSAAEQAAALLGCAPGGLVWTSGATEAINLVLRSLLGPDRGQRTIAVGATEHKAVLDTVNVLTEGTDNTVVTLPTDPTELLETVAALRPGGVDAVAVMAVNNETGTIGPYPQVAELCADRQIPYLCDATQLIGKRPLDIATTLPDAFVVASAHKFYGPQGVGLLAIPAAHRALLQPLLTGGGHQHGLRSGTLNLPGIVGGGVAAELAVEMMDDRAAHAAACRAALLETLYDEQIQVEVNGEPGVPHIVNVHIRGIDGDVLVARCPQIALATGSACTSAVPTPSHVLRALYADDRARQSIRMSFGDGCTVDEVRQAAKMVCAEVRVVRDMEALR